MPWMVALASAPSMLYWVDCEEGERFNQTSDSNVAQKTFSIIDLAALSERYVSPLRSPWIWSDFSNFVG
jgi:hypothetical protein